MKVCFIVTRADSIGGAQIHVLHLSAALKDLGHQPLVISGHRGALSRELEAEGIPHRTAHHLRREIHPLRDARALGELVRLLKDIRPDILSTHSSKAGLLGRIAGRRLGIATVFTAHGWAFAEGTPGLPRFIYRQFERLTVPLAHSVITVCEADRQLALGYGIGHPDRLVTIHNGVPNVPPQMLANPGGSGECRLVTVARLEPQKDLGVLLNALAVLKDHPWRLQVVGDGSLRSRLEAMTQDLGLAHRVEFLGFQRDVPHILARHQAFALPSRWEGLPRTILEAMRAGLPTIASDVGGVREAIEDGSTGFLVQGRDTKDWIGPLSRLLSSPSVRQGMGQAARQRYLERFTLERMVDRTLSVYRSVLPSHPNQFKEEA